MKNLKLFKKENLKKFKIAGSIVGSIALISLSGCKVAKVEDNNSSHNIQTNEIIGSIISESTPSIVNSDVPETISTTTTYIESISETTPTTTQTTTTQVPETTIITTPITTTTMTTPEPITSITISTTTSQTTTTKPIETKPITTTQTTTVTTTAVQTTPVETPPIEYSSRTEEIKAYYINNVKHNNINTLTKNNINNFNDFLNVANNFHSDTSVSSGENSLILQNYIVYYNLNTNSTNKYKTNSYIEKIIFLSLLNEEYLNDNTLKKILGIYTYDELKGLNDNMIYILTKDMRYENYYDYSKIVINKNLRTLLTNVQNAYREKDYVTLEKLCNENFGKYNTMVDSILLSYGYLSNEIYDFPTEETAFELAQKAIDDMGIYDRLHPKTLVLQ